jgi:quercetin dioxygenase-like cupin family protein
MEFGSQGETTLHLPTTGEQDVQYCLLRCRIVESAHDAILIPAEQLGWVRHGGEHESTVLSGDPDTSGRLYVMRYRILTACEVPAHWHPEDEHVTVIAGELALGFGERFSTDILRPLAAGSYALVPSRQPHFTRYTAGTVVQVHGIGPLVINYLDR